MKKLYICRGLPGAGKSTYARTLAPLVVEPDMFRYDCNNRYVFDSGRNYEVNHKAEQLCQYAMTALDMPVIAVTAAFGSPCKLEPYFEMARAHGYEVTVVECLGDYPNVHNVPVRVISEMRRNYETFTAEMADARKAHLRIVADGRVVGDVR